MIEIKLSCLDIWICAGGSSSFLEKRELERCYRKCHQSRILNLVTNKTFHHDCNDHITSYFFHFDVVILSLAKVRGLQSRQKQGPKNAFTRSKKTYF